MSEYKVGESYLADWKREYRWLRDAQHLTPEEIAEGKSDFKKTWRLFCKVDRHGAWIERRAIRAEARAAQLEDAKKLADYHFDLAIKDRDIASYQARMEAARIAYDAAQQFKADNCFDYMHAAMIIFRQIAGENAERKS